MGCRMTMNDTKRVIITKLIFCKELNREYSTQLELFKALKANYQNIISLKKAAVYKSCDKGQFSPLTNGIKQDAIKGIDIEDGYIYPVINTTKYMDSHSDVHFDGIWNKSIKDNDGKLFYVLEHSLSVKDVIAWPEDVEAFTVEIPWSTLGKSYTGNTQALVYKISKDKIVNADAIAVISNGRKAQNSVRMQYVRIKFAANSDDKDLIENKLYFDSRINEIANKEEVLEQGYFWGVEEAKIYKEGSMVLFGSNPITPILTGDNAPGKTTIIDQPVETTDPERNLVLLNLINL